MKETKQNETNNWYEVQACFDVLPWLRQKFKLSNIEKIKIVEMFPELLRAWALAPNFELGHTVKIYLYDANGILLCEVGVETTPARKVWKRNFMGIRRECTVPAETRNFDEMLKDAIRRCPERQSLRYVIQSFNTTKWGGEQRLVINKVPEDFELDAWFTRLQEQEAEQKKLAHAKIRRQLGIK